MEEIILDKIEWSTPEYKHKERDNDWFWTIGLITIVACGIAIWLGNYVFAIFLLVSGASLILFSIRHPHMLGYTIETKGLTMHKEMHEWKNIKSFWIKKGDDESKLLIETSKYFLPVYTILIPNNLVDKINEQLMKVIPKKEIEESRSMAFAEKIGF
jgi:hypothetical protein